MLFSNLVEVPSIVPGVWSKSVNYGFTLIKEILKPSIVYPSIPYFVKAKKGYLMEGTFYMIRSMPFLRENIVPNLYVYLDLYKQMYIYTKNRIDRESLWSVHNRRVTSYEKFVYFS